jgi:polyisoprenyl-phosphate glycosyltransferase
MKTISVVTPCYNEEGNVQEIYERVRAVMAKLGKYRYEHIFIDNASRDRTLDQLRVMAYHDKNVKVIVNTRNFGHIRSPFHALCQARGDAVINIMCDLEEPPELIAELIAEWEKGFPIVLAVKHESDENPFMFWLRRKYYQLIRRLSDIDVYENFTGFGLYDRKVMDLVKTFSDPYPYFRGMIAEIGFPHAEVKYHHAARKRGITKNNLYTLYDLAMLGITNLSKVPLRIVTLSGFACSALCVLIAVAYLAYKLVYWDRFSAGIAPVVLGLFFFSSIQLFFMGLLGEYIGTIHTLVQKRPLVFEGERINFEFTPGEPFSGPHSVAEEPASPTSNRGLLRREYG